MQAVVFLLLLLGTCCSYAAEPSDTAGLASENPRIRSVARERIMAIYASHVRQAIEILAKGNRSTWLVRLDAIQPSFCFT